MRGRKIPLWVYPVGLALLLTPPSGHIQTPADGGWYMSAALNIAQGRGYVDVDWTPITQRGPLFPAWLALAFQLFGASVGSAFLASRVFYVLGIGLVYAAGAKLFHPQAGLWAALLVLTSTSLSRWSALIHLDHVLPALLVLYLLLLMKAYESRRFVWFTASGAILGLAYLLKEMALLFLPLPLLLWLVIPKWRTRQNIYGVLVLLATALVVILPWWAYAYTITGRWEMLGGGAGPRVTEGFLSTLQAQGIRAVTSGLPTYYAEYLAPHFGLAPLLALAWGITAMLALRSIPERVLIATALCFLPMVLFQGLLGWRARQSVIFFLLSYLALAGAAWRGWEALSVRLSRRSARARALLPLLPWVVGAALVGGQLLSEGGQWVKFAAQYNVPAFLAQGGWQGVEARGWHREEAQQLGQWLLEHVPLGTPILSDWQFKTAIYFFADGKYPLYSMPRLCSRNFASNLCTHGASSAPRPKVLFLWPDTGARVRSLTQYDLVALTEEDLFQALQRTRAQYVIVTLRTNFESLYLEQSPSFQRVAEFGQGMFKVYRVLRPLRPIDFTPHVAKRTASYLRLLQAEAPDKYRYLLDVFVRGRLGWTNRQIQLLLRGDLPTLQLHQRY